MSPEGKIETKQIYLNGLNDAGGSCLEGDLGGSPRDENHEIACVQFCCIFRANIENFGIYMWSTS